jgi:hypothetical protein
MSQAPAHAEPNPLRPRLAGLRRRLRTVILWRGTGWLLSLVLLALVLAGLLDWRLHLPGLVRAVLLVGTLTGAALVAYRHLLKPLAARTDDLSLALQIEKQYPILNDGLASTVEFLEQADDSDRFGSPSLRREAIRRGLRRTKNCDFTRIIDRRGVRVAGLSMAAACALAITLILLNPRVAGTAVLRLANPFGGPAWPRQTQLEVDPPRKQIGRNEPFDIHAVVRGVIPSQASVVFQLDGLPQVEQICDVSRAEEADSGEVRARLDAGRVQRNFTFQVRANDAVSERYGVEVLPPPQLVPLGGRASPQVHLDYPAYTDLLPSDLPDGSGNVEAVAGTVVTLRAAADRPLARAWIEFQPEPRGVTMAAFLAPLGAHTTAQALALTAAGEAVWDAVPAALGAERREIAVRFLPRVSGLYVLHFVDDIGLHNSRLFELRVVPDPAPVVNLERPTPSRDSLALLPEAEFTLQVTADDILFAVRSVGLEYRCKKGDPPRALPLYDHQAAGLALSGMLTGLSGGALPLPPPLRLRPQHVQVTRRVALQEFRHLDPAGSGLKEGDVVILRAAGDDFDDVSVDKQPGRSHEVEIQIIGRNALDIALNKEQARIQKELVKLREQQREALKKVRDTEQKSKHQEKLTPEQLDELQQAEQLQQQIRERVGAERQEGLRAEVARLLDTLKDNNLPRSAAHERMEAVQAELDRLAREELDQIEPRLTNVRKENDSPGQKDPKLLTEARKHQEEIEKTLNDLLSRLEPWTSTQEIKGEAKSILQEQRKLNQQTEQNKDSLGDTPGKMTEAQRAELERLQEQQQKLQQRTDQLLQKMDRVSQERHKDKDEETAQELQNALKQANAGKPITGLMQDARTELENNQLANASKAQKESIKRLEEVVKELEDRREAELDRLAKKLRDIEQRMDDLARQQEDLQKKAMEAAGISDPKQREEELKKLARKQEELKKKAEDMAEELKRLRAARASEALGKAGGEMENAQKQLEGGGKAEEQQDDALDRLQEARDELKRTLGDTEEELAREQLAKVAVLLKKLRDRQQALVTEAGRIQKDVLEAKGWNRPREFSLRDLANAQKGLGEETGKVADEKLSEALVFRRILHKAAKAMGDAADRINDRYQEVSQQPDKTDPDEETGRLQQEALRRLDQLLEAAKPDAGVPQRAAGGGGGGGGGESSGGGGNPDGIPPLAQLKLLRAMQADINQRTEDFTKQHPDLTRLDDKGKSQLQSIRRDQEEVADLLDELTHPQDQPEGDKP